VPGPNVQRTAGADEVARFRDDYDNARVALAWAWDTGMDELGIDLGAACARYWLGEGLFRDASSWLSEARPRIPSVSAESQLRGLKICGLLAFFVLADSDRAEALWAEARLVAERLHLDAEVAWLEHRRAGIQWERGDISDSIASYERLLAYHRARGDDLAEADSLHNLGEALRDIERFEAAERHLLAADAIYRRIGANSGVLHNMHSLGDLALDRREYVSAMALYRQSMEGGIATDDQRFQAYCLAGMASALPAAGRDEDAALVWGAVCAAEESRGFRMLTLERRRYEEHLTRLEQTAAWRSGRALTLHDAFAALGDS